MDTNTVELVIVADRSGSMDSIFEASVTGLRELLKKQVEGPGNINFTLVTFDTQIEEPVRRANLKDQLVTDHLLNNLNTWLKPRNSTALYDAMGTTIDNVGKYLAEMPEEKRPGQVIVVVVTDGFENASRQYRLSDIKSRIELQTTTYNWQFMFIGANQDAILTADSMGINAQFALNYSATSKGSQGMYESIGRSLERTRYAVVTGNSVAAASAFTEEERNLAVD